MRYRWWSDVNSFPKLDGQTQFGPTFSYEYSTREAYGKNINWGANDPLNATWWHLVTERAYRLLDTLHDFSSDMLFCLQRCKRTQVSFRFDIFRICAPWLTI